MCCVYSHARIASSASLWLGFAVPIIFHESPMVAFILCWLLTILFLSLRLPVYQPVIPLACSFIVSLLSEVPSQHGSILALITFVLRLTGRSNWLFLPFHNSTGTYALSTHNFFFLFLSWRYTHLFSAKLRSGCLFDFGPAWTASGLGQWFFHESSFFFTDKSLPMGSKQNVYSQINPRRTTFPRRLVASNKLNINQLKFRNYEKV